MAYVPISSEQIPAIAAYAIGDPKYIHIEMGQVEHRLKLLEVWQIPPGSRVLEIGCGQGNTTSVLAAAVGPVGHVDAVDPASLDYGSPCTLGEAQAHLSASEIGSRITWHNIDPLALLARDTTTTWDHVVFAHSIWYFNTPDMLSKMLLALKGRATHLQVAEYALQATKKAAEPHLLAAIARASLEAFNKESEANIRCLLGPVSIKEYAKQAGWKAEAEAYVVPAASLEDGGWETAMVKNEEFMREVEKHVSDDRVKMLLKSSREAVIAAAAALGDEKVHTMDVWVSRFS